MKEITLIRKEISEDGYFGEICIGKEHFFTCERTYKDKKQNTITKVKDGSYICQKGMHRLKVESPEFETFEVKGVKGHWGILFHVGNYPTDSDGCILIGEGIGFTNRKTKMLTNSRKAFKRFMEIFKEEDRIRLTVYTMK